MEFRNRRSSASVLREQPHLQAYLLRLNVWPLLPWYFPRAARFKWPKCGGGSLRFLWTQNAWPRN